MHTVNVCVFDKTGTLTKGKPCVTDSIVLSDELENSALLSLLGSAESVSGHPVGLALTNLAKETSGVEFCVPDNVIEDMGSGGISCTIRGVSVRVGNYSFVSGEVPVIPSHAREVIEGFESEGKSVVYLLVNQKLSALFALIDVVRQESAYVVHWLQERGIETKMVTGDRLATAKSIAEQVGIKRNDIHAEMKPHQKLNMIMGLQEQGKVVMMIGDGINDSPALAQANVGVAIGVSSPVAVEAAGIVLMKNSLWDLVVGLDLSEAVFRRIRLNFVWAFMYNIIGVPLAAGLLYPLIHPLAMPPSFCAFTMALSSTTVVVSSLLLKRYKPPTLPGLK